MRRFDGVIKFAITGLIVFSGAAVAHAVEKAGPEYYPRGMKNAPVYLVITPPKGQMSQIKSGNTLPWKALTKNIVNEVIPKNKTGASREPLDALGWDGSISFKIDPGAISDPQSTLDELRTKLGFDNKSGMNAGGEVRFDGLMYPMQLDPKKNLWMYSDTAIDAGAANVSDAWTYAKGRSVTVGIMDTGQINHQNLKTAGPGYDFISDPVVSQDSDTIRDNDPTDEGDYLTASEARNGQFQKSSWHGSHVQGTVAGTSDFGFTGVAPESRALAVRVLGKGGGRDSDIVDGAYWLLGERFADGSIPDNNFPAQVINMSLGTSSPTPCFPHYQALFDKALEKGVTVVVAAGNEGENSKEYAPGNCDNIITVAATTREGRRAYYSNYGPNVDISAPGGESYKRFVDSQDGKYYLRATPNNGLVSTISQSETDNSDRSKVHAHYEGYQGTSMATPMVSGIIALWQSYSAKHLDRYLTPAEVREVMTETAQPFPKSDDPDLQCDTQTCGAGIIDAAAGMKYIEKMSKNAVKPNPIERPKVRNSENTCLSQYEVAKKLYGADKAAVLFPKQYSYVGPCPQNSAAAEVIEYQK